MAYVMTEAASGAKGVRQPCKATSSALVIRGGVILSWSGAINSTVFVENRKKETVE